MNRKSPGRARKSRRHDAAGTVQPVLDAIARTAARLCDARDAQIFQADGETLRQVARHGRFRSFADSREPFPLTRGLVGARAVIDRKTIHVHDMARAVRKASPDLRARQRMFGARTVLATPLLRNGAAIGVILIRRTRVRPFTAKQIALLKTFADQAAIAIENARLSTELASRNHDLTEALEQQTATSEILRVISSSPTDVQPTLDALAAAARRLCGAADAAVALREGDTWITCAHDGALPVSRDPRPLDRGSVNGRAILDGRTVHLPRMSEVDPQEFPLAVALAREHGFGAGLAAPMLRDGVAVGVIGLRRGQEGAFTPRQIELLQTFADQAVIAIENVRLFKELEARNRDLTESLEQQTATAEILRVISQSPTDLEPVLQTVARTAARLCDAVDAVIMRVDGPRLRPAAHFGPIPLEQAFLEGGMPLTSESVGGRAVAEQRRIHVDDLISAEAAFPLGSGYARRLGYHTTMAVPLLRQGTAIGTITIRRAEVRPFTESQMALLETFADQAVIAIENVRLFQELESSNGDLRVALEQQTATSELLKVIGRSTFDIQPVFETLAENAVRLCEGHQAFIFRFDGQLLRVVASHNTSPELRAFFEQNPIAPGRGSVAGRAALERRTIHIDDVRTDPERTWDAHRVDPIRTVLTIPMLRAGEVFGVIGVNRLEVRAFSDSQVALLETFADQAAIAIENARLLNELQQKNAHLSEALDQQTATAEILRAISASPTDTTPVFEAIVRNAARLCEATSSWIYLLDGDVLERVAPFNVPADVPSRFPVANAPNSTRVIREGVVFHVADVESDPRVTPRALQQAGAMGARALLQVPMKREGSPIGSIVVLRRDPGRFTDKQVALLQTFADQAVIAIENVRLFNELEARNRDLTEALERQTATGEILQVISSSPTDVQPVFDTIARSAARLCDAFDVIVLRVEDDVLRLVAHHGPIPAGDVPVHRGTLGGRTVIDRRLIHVADLQAEVDEFPEGSALARDRGHRTALSVPLLKDGVAVGNIQVRRDEVRLFSDQQISLLQTFADQAVIAIENVRLFTELETRNSELRVALEQQTATSELLKVIGRSTFDLQPVFETLAESAGRLCEAEQTAIFRFDGQFLRVVVTNNLSPANREFTERNPIALGRNSGAGRAALERRTIHIHDVQTDPEYTYGAGQLPFRTLLAIPMLRAGELLGMIGVQRDEVRPFTDNQIALLETFADQAAIAIENARLLNELQAKNRALTESNAQVTDALDRQTATAEVLRVISSSPTDVQPVFDAILTNALRLCEATNGSIFTFDGATFRLVAAAGISDRFLEYFRQATIVPGPETPLRRVGLDARVSHVVDILTDRSFSPPDAYRRENMRTLLAVPMLKQGRLIGAITFHRHVVRAFSDKQIALLETFADQAVIAIENVRLFNELESRNRELRVTLDQQIATADILRVISRSPTDVQPVFQAIVDSAARLLRGNSGVLSRIVGGQIELAAFTRTDDAGDALLASLFPISLRPSASEVRPIRDRVIGERIPYNVADVETDPGVGERGRANARARGYRSQLVVPMLRHDEPLGTIAVTRSEPGAFSDEEIALLTTFADQAVIAIENARLLHELQAKNADLTEALEQQMATSEILRVISSSPTDVQPVFDAIAEAALRLCSADSSIVTTFDGELMHLSARAALSGEGADAFRAVYPRRPDMGSAAGRAILTHAIVQIPDVAAHAEYDHRQLARAIHLRSILAVPTLRDGVPIGTINVHKAEPGAFTGKQIALLETFADQAVIAIENVRLFKELQARTTQLTRSVDELTALGEVSRALSSTLDLETVLNTIVARANQLAGTESCSVYEYDEESAQFHLRATDNLDEEIVAVARRTPVRRGEGLLGRMAVTREPVQVSDIAGEDAYRGPLRDVLLRAGTRALLAVPLLRDDRLVGGLTVNKKTPGEFPPEVVDLLRTFATQSALAIQNARLFREIEDKGRQLEVASRHKSQFLANMSHELRTPLNAILGYTELIADSIYGEVPERMREVLERVDKSGRHLLGLINDILDLSKIEAGQLTLTLSPYSMDGVAQTVATQIGALAAEKQLGFELVLAEDMPLGQGDERRLTQVLLNLVGNAIKFTDVGKIVVRVGTSADAYAVSVTDTGPGIADADRENIFEEFQQADTTRAKAKGGTGLGLAISRRIVEMHGGRLWVESTLGEGATFSFTVPITVEQQVDAPASRPVS